MAADISQVTISAVVPTHNSPHIEACLESVMRQAGVRLEEVIVVDDASTDETVQRSLEVGSRYPDKKLRIVRLERNRGPSAAKNAGIAKAKSPYIAAVDSDVVLEEGCLRKLAEDLQSSGGSAAMAYFMVPRELRVLTRVIGYDLEFRLSRILRGRTWVEVGKVGTGATLFRRSDIIEAGLFDESRRVGEDTAFSYRLREMGRKLVISERAKCRHYWQSRGLGSYIRQQIGYGEGILEAYMDSRRMPRDPVSGPLLRFNAFLAALSVGGVLLSVFWGQLLILALVAVILQLIIDLRSVRWILIRKRDWSAGFVAPIVFLVRNYSWATSIVTVLAKHLTSIMKRSDPMSRKTSDPK